MDLRTRLDSALSHRYRIQDELGAGGMAVVFRAQDLKHDRPVAIKVLRPDVAAAMGSERFLREIEIAARLNHPNILPLHDSGEADGLLYFVMPYVEGDSLRQRLNREGGLSLAETLNITREVGGALEFAHGQGLVHRDVKPGNILMQAGHAMVCDFGIAKAAKDAREHLTRTGLAVGTLGYMSPEQLTGEAEVDGRTDVFALGCIVFEMLCGEAPFKGPTSEAVLARQLRGEIPHLAGIRGNLPSTLQAVLATALAPDPQDRFPTPGAFISALEDAATAEAQARHLRHQRLQRLAGVGITILLAALLATGGWRLAEVFQGPTVEKVAVLPLTSRTSGTQQDYLLAGMHQDLITELARAGVRVITASSVSRYGGSDRPIREIAEELSVDGIVEGSAVREGDRVRMELSFVDPVTLEVRWVESFGGNIGSIVALYRQAALAIADRLGTPLTPEARNYLAQVPQEQDPQVVEALYQARFHWQKLTAEGLDTALDYYQLAVRRDSTSVEGWQGIALVWRARIQEGMIPPDEGRVHADSAMARMAALDPNRTQDPAGLALQKTWYEWSWDEAEAAFREALDRDPTDSVTRAYFAILLLYLGRVDEAEVQMERAAEMDPFNTLVQGLYAQGLNALHRPEEAEAHLLKVRERNPEAPMVLTTLRTTYHLMGRHEEAMDMWRASYAASEDQEALDALERGWADGGYSAALRSVAELMVTRSDTMYVRPIVIGTLYTRAGMKEEALHYLQLAFEEKSSGIPYLSIDPIFDLLRDDPRFRAILDEIGLPG